MKTALEIKTNKFIDERDRLSNEITRNWKIIATENIIKKGTIRNYDMKQLLAYIKTLYEKLILTKLRIQCANMGMKLKDLPKDANIINIYKLSAYNEYCVKVDELMRKHTIKPILKIKKGKRALSVTEELTYSYLKREKDSYTVKANKIRKEIEDFNNKDLTDDTTPLFLVA